MNRMIEVIYDDNVLKPLKPIKGLKKKREDMGDYLPSSEKESFT